MHVPESPKRNKLERLKASLAPSAFAAQLPELDWSHLDERRRFYLKNYGIYTSTLRPEMFMLRLRIDGGRLAPDVWAALADVFREHRLKLLITARAQMELHGIAPTEVYRLYTALQAIGISTHQTLTDNVRAITTDPYDGVAADSRIDAGPIIQTIRNRLLDRSEWMGMLPRKFNTALIGREVPLSNPWANDMLFALARKEDRWGFNVYLGGKNSAVARSADVFVLPEDAADVFWAALRTFSQHGSRGSRAKIRLFHLIESAGMAAVRDRIEAALGRPLERSGTRIMRRSASPEYTPLHNGKYGQILRSRYGELDTETLYAWIQRAAEYHGEIRLGADQNLHLIGIDAPSEDTKTPQVIACAGIRYCPLALRDIKRDIPALPLERFAAQGITIGMSGCLKGCGRHYHSDIGLFGLRTNLYGPTERAVRVYLGAIQEGDPAPGRMLYYSVPERMILRLLHVIMDDFLRSRFAYFEAYARFLRRYTPAWWQLWYLMLHDAVPTALMQGVHAGREEKVLASEAERFLGMALGRQYADAIRTLSHRYWGRNNPSQHIKESS